MIGLENIIWAATHFVREWLDGWSTVWFWYKSWNMMFHGLGSEVCQVSMAHSKNDPPAHHMFLRGGHRMNGNEMWITIQIGSIGSLINVFLLFTNCLDCLDRGSNLYAWFIWLYPFTFKKDCICALLICPFFFAFVFSFAQAVGVLFSACVLGPV